MQFLEALPPHIHFFNDKVIEPLIQRHYTRVIAASQLRRLRSECICGKACAWIGLIERHRDQRHLLADTRRSGWDECRGWNNNCRCWERHGERRIACQQAQGDDTHKYKVLFSMKRFHFYNLRIKNRWFN